jgi:hypothetical protein
LRRTESSQQRVQSGTEEREPGRIRKKMREGQLGELQGMDQMVK